MSSAGRLSTSFVPPRPILPRASIMQQAGRVRTPSTPTSPSSASSVAEEEWVIPWIEFVRRMSVPENLRAAMAGRSREPSPPLKALSPPPLHHYERAQRLRARWDSVRAQNLGDLEEDPLDIGQLSPPTFCQLECSDVPELSPDYLTVPLHEQRRPSEECRAVARELGSFGEALDDDENFDENLGDAIENDSPVLRFREISNVAITEEAEPLPSRSSPATSIQHRPSVTAVSPHHFTCAPPPAPERVAPERVAPERRVRRRVASSTARTPPVLFEGYVLSFSSPVSPDTSSWSLSKMDEELGPKDEVMTSASASSHLIRSH